MGLSATDRRAFRHTTTFWATCKSSALGSRGGADVRRLKVGRWPDKPERPGCPPPPRHCFPPQSTVAAPSHANSHEAVGGARGVGEAREFLGGFHQWLVREWDGSSTGRTSGREKSRGGEGRVGGQGRGRRGGGGDHTSFHASTAPGVCD